MCVLDRREGALNFCCFSMFFYTFKFRLTGVWMDGGKREHIFIHLHSYTQEKEGKEGDETTATLTYSYTRSPTYSEPAVSRKWAPNDDDENTQLTGRKNNKNEN